MIAMSEIRNLLPDPKPAATVKWATPSNKNVSMQMLSDNRLHITNNANINDSYIYTQLQLPAGTYRFGAEVSDPQNEYAGNMLRMVKQNPTTELDPARWDGVAGRLVTPANEITADGPVELRIMVGAKQNSAVWVRQLFLMTEEDYQQMIDAGIAWFDGDSIVREDSAA